MKNVTRLKVPLSSDLTSKTQERKQFGWDLKSVISQTAFDIMGSVISPHSSFRVCNESASPESTPTCTYPSSWSRDGPTLNNFHSAVTDRQHAVHTAEAGTVGRRKCVTGKAQRWELALEEHRWWPRVCTATDSHLIYLDKRSKEILNPCRTISAEDWTRSCSGCLPEDTTRFKTCCHPDRPPHRSNKLTEDL